MTAHPAVRHSMRMYFIGVRNVWVMTESYNTLVKVVLVQLENRAVVSLFQGKTRLLNQFLHQLVVDKIVFTCSIP